MLDDFSCRQTAEASAGFMIDPASKAEQEACSVKVARARCIHELLDAACRNSLDRFRSDDKRALFGTGDDAERALFPQSGDRCVKVGRCIEAFQLVLIGEQDINLSRAEKIAEFVAVAIDSKTI